MLIGKLWSSTSTSSAIDCTVWNVHPTAGMPTLTFALSSYDIMTIRLGNVPANDFNAFIEAKQ